MSELTIGTDLEFILKRGGEFIRADHVFGPHLRTDGVIGTDGHPQTGEIRPKESTCTLKVVTNIYNALRYVKSIFESHGISMHVGHMVASKSLGGHIHFSIPHESDHYFRLVRYLDFFLDNIISEHTDDLDDKLDRRRSGYGCTGDTRPQPWGFEYRTPGSFIHNPELAMVYFSIAKMCAIVSNKESIDVPGVYYGSGPLHAIHTLYDRANELADDMGISSDDMSDCRVGMSMIDRLFRRESSINWDDNILLNW